MFKHEVHKDFVVLHTNGIHVVNVDPCGCSTQHEPPVSLPKQLLRAGWYPATHLNPQMCATFELMQAFHLLSLQGKISHYHYYKALQYRTDNTGINKIPVRFHCIATWCTTNEVHSVPISSLLSHGAQVVSQMYGQTGCTRICSEREENRGDGTRRAGSGLSSMPYPGS